MDKEALKNFMLKNSSDSRFYGLFYKEKQLLKQNDLMGFAQYQLKKNKNMLIGAFAFIPICLLQLAVQFPIYLETGSIFALSVSIFILACCFVGLFISTKEYYTIKSSMTLLIAVLEEELEKPIQEDASSSSAEILSKA